MQPTGKHILLFEEDTGLKRVMTLLLKQADFRVTSLSNIETALGWLATHERETMADILIVDVSGPDQQGDRMLRQLQRSDSELPVVIIYPYGSEELEATEGRSLNYRFLTSPFSPEELLASIRDISKDR
jgi:DNA-binding NtrC family response regulator